MTVAEDTTGRIKVVLTKNDLCDMGLEFEKLDCSDPETRLLLRAVFKMAAIEIGKNFDTQRLLIEAYPHIHGGGILYFTPLKEQIRRKRLRLKQTAQLPDTTISYVFYDGGNFLRAVELLYSNIHTRALSSQAFSIDNKFVLTIDSPGGYSPIHEVKEFSDLFLQGENIKKYTCEHGTVLAGDNAIFIIGSKISPAF